MLTLVISLPDAVKRQEKISAELRCAGLAFSMIPGVVGRNLTRSELASFAPSRFMVRFSRELGPGEIGCTLSHKLALEAFLATDEAMALILEDDAVVPTGLGEAIARLVERLPQDWGFLKIGGFGGVRGRLVSDTSFGKLVATTATTVYSHAYVVSRQGAERLLHNILPVRFPYDIYRRDAHSHGAKVFEVVPTLVSQTDMAGSCLAAERADTKLPFGVRHVLAYPVWKLSHETKRRLHLIKTFGLSLAVSPSKIRRYE